MEGPKHEVAVTALVSNVKGEILLQLSPWRGWEIPGGRVEEGEDLIQALEREVYEETGTAIKVGQLVGVYSNLAKPGVILGFLADYTGGELTPSEESVEVKWCPREDVLKHITHPVLYDRLVDMLSFAGTIKYRAYAAKLDGTSLEYHIHKEHKF